MARNTKKHFMTDEEATAQAERQELARQRKAREAFVERARRLHPRGGAVMTPEERHLAEALAHRGLVCEVEAGPVGLVVYGGSARDVLDAAAALAGMPRGLGCEVAVSAASSDPDEPPQTRWWATVEFDWERIGGAA